MGNQVDVKDTDLALQKATAFRNAAEDITNLNNMLQKMKADIEVLDMTGSLNERVLVLIDSYDGGLKSLVSGLEDLAKQLDNACQAMAAFEDLKHQESIM
jgi:hypothetical protein